MHPVAADIVVVIHFLWILFLILGAYWGLKHRLIKIVHLSGLAFAIILQIFGWYCPLTHLEIRLRSRYAPFTSYSGSFIIHYLEKFIYLDAPHSLITAMTVMLVLANLAVYSRSLVKRLRV